MDRPVLVFDGDCGMCTRAAGLVEQRFRPAGAFDVAPGQRLDLPDLGLTEEQAQEALQWVEPSGRIASGHAAVAAMLRHSHPWARPIGALLTAPGLDPLAALAYRWVARNRQLFPGGTPACALPAPGAGPADGEPGGATP